MHFHEGRVDGDLPFLFLWWRGHGNCTHEWKRIPESEVVVGIYDVALLHPRGACSSFRKVARSLGRRLYSLAASGVR